MYDCGPPACVKSRVTALDDLAVVDRRDELVLQTDVRERAADHDLVVAAARAVGVEVLLRDAVSVRYCAAGVPALMLPAGRCDRS
jgi:hypothetical protein